MSDKTEKPNDEVMAMKMPMDLDEKFDVLVKAVQHLSAAVGFVTDGVKEIQSEVCKNAVALENVLEGVEKIAKVTISTGTIIAAQHRADVREVEREFVVCHTCGGSKSVRRVGKTSKEECPACHGKGEIELKEIDG